MSTFIKTVADKGGKMTLYEAISMGEAEFAIDNDFNFIVLEEENEDLESAQAITSCNIFIPLIRLDEIPKELNWREVCVFKGFAMLSAHGLNANDIIDVLEEVFGKFSRIIRPKPKAVAQT